MTKLLYSVIFIILFMLYHLFQYDINRLLERIKYKLSYLKLSISRSINSGKY